MNMRKYMILAVCAAMPVLWSCSEGTVEEPAIEYEVTSAPSFTYVADGTENGVVFTGASYSIAFNDDKHTATIEMRNVRFAVNESGANYVLSDVPFRGDNSTKARIISLDRVTPDKLNSPVFTQLEIVALAKKEIDINGDATKPVEAGGIAVSYIVDNRRSVVEIPFRTVFEGTTSTVNTTNQKSFVSSKSVYIVDIDADKKKAVLRINDPSFDANMPSLGTMVFGSTDDAEMQQFGSIDVVLTEGGFNLKCDRLIPSIAGTPYPRFEITNLKMTALPGGKSELSFNCMVYKVAAVFGAAYTPE